MECNHDWVLNVNAGMVYDLEPLSIKYRDICTLCGKGKKVDLEELKKREISELIIHEIENWEGQ